MFHPGTILDDKYRIVRLVGEGGMGAVYEGLRLSGGPTVAIKIMHARIAREREAVRRFEREAQAAARIGSRHIVDVLDTGELPKRGRYMVMEYLEGESLSSRLKDVARLPLHAVAHIGVQLLEGLAKVHEAGIVHRDLKPANVFLVRAGDGSDFVKILDFGVCKIPTHRLERELLTKVGDVLGTPAYMAPEQIEHGPAGVDGRADLYAVGILLYRAAAGRLPHKAKDFVQLLVKLRDKKNPPLRALAPDLDPRFAAIVDRAVEWDRERRWQTARTFQRALVEWMRRAVTDQSVAGASPDRRARPSLVRLEPSRAASVRAALRAVPDPDAPTRVGATAARRPTLVVREKKKLPPVRPPPKRAAPKPRPSMSDAETGRLRLTEEIEIPIDFDDDAETLRGGHPRAPASTRGRRK